MLKVTHKGIILKQSKELDTSSLSKCMDFLKTLHFVKCLCRDRQSGYILVILKVWMQQSPGWGEGKAGRQEDCL